MGLARVAARPSLTYGALGAVAAVVVLFLGDEPGGAVVYDAVAVSTVFAVVAGILLFRPARVLPWALIAFGSALTAAGEITWEVYEALGQSPFPSVADVLYLAGYPVVGTGLVLLAHGRDRDRRLARRALLDASIVTVAASLVAWVLLVQPYAADTSLPLVERALSAAYPLADLVLLTLLVRLLFTPGAFSPAFVLLGTGVVTTIAADATFAYLELSGGYTAGTWVDLLWLVGYVFVGSAALHPSMAVLGTAGHRGAPALTRLRLLALAAAAVTAPAVLALDAARGDVENVAVIVVAATLLPLLALVRLAGLVRELQEVAAERERLYQSERAARAEAETMQNLLSEQNDRLRELDRLKDEFVALVSHELRTPLTSIAGYLELVLDDGRLDEEQRRFLHVVDRNARRLLRLVSDLLFVAQIDAGRVTLERGDVDLASLAGESVEALRPAAQAKGVDLRLDARPLPVLHGDGARLGQLLDNLVSNAVKFTPSDGRVVVSLGQSGGDVVLAVSDTGIGVPAGEQRQLFDRFFRASSAKEQAIEGTGLGLTIARAIAEAHGGAIEFASTEGEGTTVRVKLPLDGTEPEAAAAAGARAESVL